MAAASRNGMSRRRCLASLVLFASLTATLLCELLCGAAPHLVHGLDTHAAGPVTAWSVGTAEGPQAGPGHVAVQPAEAGGGGHHARSEVVAAGHSHDGGECGDRHICPVRPDTAGVVSVVGVLIALLIGLAETICPLSATAGLGRGCRSVRRRVTSDCGPRRLAQLCVLRA